MPRDILVTRPPNARPPSVHTSTGTLTLYVVRRRQRTRQPVRVDTWTVKLLSDAGAHRFRQVLNKTLHELNTDQLDSPAA